MFRITRRHKSVLKREITLKMTDDALRGFLVLADGASVSIFNNYRCAYLSKDTLQKCKQGQLHAGTC